VASIPVYLERGAKRTFACAVDWPGWCRSGRDPDAALAALLEAAPRYARALRGTQLGFTAPKDASGFRVVETLKGDATTDFGAPGGTPKDDARPVTDADMRRAGAILRASWRAFDEAARAAKGKTLTKGPRGGGRDLAKIVRHVVEADAGYIGALGWTYRLEPEPPERQLERTRKAMLDGLAASARGEIPERGPRGGVRSKPRRIVRRSAWHWLDHAWEIEDRAGLV
jgi:hypothetical protein